MLRRVIPLVTQVLRYFGTVTSVVMNIDKKTSTEPCWNMRERSPMMQGFWVAMLGRVRASVLTVFKKTSIEYA